MSKNKNKAKEKNKVKEKTDLKTDIAKIKPGQIDDAGNKVVHILAKANEYCIYEIEHSDINYRLRVLIDGYTDESEKNLVNRFNIVKNGYIIAKGLLYRSQNYGMMKNRVSHILSACLQNSKMPTGNEFQELIDEIEKEIEQISKNRLFYIGPSTILTIISAVICVFSLPLRIESYQTWHILVIVFSSLLGNSISVLSGISKMNFEERTNWHYILLGIERVFLSCVAGVITYCLIRSKFIFPQIEIKDYWKVMVIVVVSAFSEKLIPNLLGKVENKIVVK